MNLLYLSRVSIRERVDRSRFHSPKRVEFVTHKIDWTKLHSTYLWTATGNFTLLFTGMPQQRHWMLHCVSGWISVLVVIGSSSGAFFVTWKTIWCSWWLVIKRQFLSTPLFVYLQVQRYHAMQLFTNHDRHDMLCPYRILMAVFDRERREQIVSSNKDLHFALNEELCCGVKSMPMGGKFAARPTNQSIDVDPKHIINRLF